MNDNFLKAMSAAGGIYNKKITKPLVQMYVDVLEPRDLDQCAAAIKAHMATGKFFPMPCDIINQLEGNQTAKATAAWDKVYSLLNNSQNAQTDDPVLEGVVKSMGGWMKLGITDYDQLGYRQHEFIPIQERTAISETAKHADQLEHDRYKQLA